MDQRPHDHFLFQVSPLLRVTSKVLFRLLPQAPRQLSIPASTHSQHQRLDTCVFRARTMYFQQVRGAGIGSQHSPALCNVAITLIEHSWHQLHHLSQTTLRSTSSTTAMWATASSPSTGPCFPRWPFRPWSTPTNSATQELEPVDDMHLLGFDVDLLQRTITYIPPTAPWKIRDHDSADSQQLRLSGLHSRAHLINKYTYPPSAIERALAQLAEMYVHDLHRCHRVLQNWSGYLFSHLPGPLPPSWLPPSLSPSFPTLLVCADFGLVWAPVSKDSCFSNCIIRAQAGGAADARDCAEQSYLASGKPGLINLVYLHSMFEPF